MPSKVNIRCLFLSYSLWVGDTGKGRMDVFFTIEKNERINPVTQCYIWRKLIQRDGEPVGWMALETVPRVTVHDLLELEKENREKKKPCDCWNEETSRNPKQYVEKITSQWAKPKINTECWQNQRRTHLPHRWSVQESTMSHVWMCKCVCTSGRNRRHGILGQIRLGLLFLDHSIIRVLFPYALNASCHVYANRLTTWLSLGLQEKHPTACW